jgi:hypothetical protein
MGGDLLRRKILKTPIIKMSFLIMKLKYRLILLLTVLSAFGAFAQEKIGITGTVEWDNMQIKAAISLDLASVGIRLPSGRTQGESILKNNYVNLIRPYILELQADSSSTIADLINRGEFSLYEAETIMLKANSIPPAFSPDMLNMTVSYDMPLSGVSGALLNHSRITEVARTLNPVSVANYTGIIIIASEELPVHGMRSAALPVPCLFPKIWDSEMNLIYERSMLSLRDNPMAHYSTTKSIFQNTPSGLSPELQKIVGDRPLRIFASGVYGIKPTDLIIDRSDALLIISSDNNRRLLSEGRVAVILDDTVLKMEF